MWRCYQEGTIIPYGFSIFYGGKWPRWWVAFVHKQCPDSQQNVTVRYLRLRWYKAPRFIYKTSSYNIITNWLNTRNLVAIQREVWEDYCPSRSILYWG